MDLNYARDTTSGREGLELVARVRALDPSLPIVVMTAWSTVPLAVAIMRNGVCDFVEKPWDNSRLLATVRAQVASGRHLRRAQRLESDARDVQRRLLSRAVPDVPGYAVGVAWRFAEQLGGDAYELAALPGGRLGVAIADVCGKGTPAALLMASAHATLRDLMTLPLSPHEVCERLDRALSPRLAPDRFVSLAYAVLDEPPGSRLVRQRGPPGAPAAARGRQRAAPRPGRPGAGTASRRALRDGRRRAAARRPARPLHRRGGGGVVQHRSGKRDGRRAPARRRCARCAG